MIAPLFKLLSFLGVMLLAGCSLAKRHSVDALKPNIIFLLTDDHRWDAVGFAGNPIIKTPHLDKLAQRGFYFKNAYVTTSICMVSRASIFSGQYMSRHGINDFYTSFTPEALAETYPAVLKKNGYRIGFVGKYGVGNPPHFPKTLFDYWAGTPLHQPNYENKDEKGNYLHYTDLLSNHITEFLKAGQSQPFCLSVSFKSPHSQDGDPRQFIPNPRYSSLYKGMAMPRAETAAPQYWEAMPKFFHAEENIARQRWKLRFATPEQYQETVRNYYRLITGVDDAVGRLVSELKQKGLDQNTIIIFMGDNGFYLGEHGLAGKWLGHEESIRVPLFIYDPRKKSPKGMKVETIALNIDIAPTILGYAGLTPPAGMQGLDLRNVANGSVARKVFFYEHTFDGSPKLPKVEGVVSPTLKYMNYLEHGYEELYDLSKDPLEKSNLAANPTFAPVLAQQRLQYLHLKKNAR